MNNSSFEQDKPRVTLSDIKKIHRRSIDAARAFIKEEHPDLAGIEFDLKRRKLAKHITKSHVTTEIEHKRELKKAKEEGEIDVLTELLNRKGFERNMHVEINRAQRNGQTLTVVYLDLNGLKAINDSENGGHAMGDKYIRAAAQVLRKNFRSTDIVARIGGDEFAVILPNTSLEIVKQIWDNHVNPAFERNDPPVKTAAGAAILDPRTDPQGNISLYNADRRLYIAKPESKIRGKNILVTEG